MADREITVTLDEEQINSLIAVAEKEKIILSALVREIVASYIGEYTAVERASLWALRRHLQGNKEGAEPSGKCDGEKSHEIQILRDEIASLRDLVTNHLDNHSASLYPSHDRQITVSPSLFEDVNETTTLSVSPPVAIDATVLVKKTKEVAPVIEAPGYGSFHEIVDAKEYSVDEVSVYLGLAPTTVRKYARDEKIPARKVNRAYVFLGKDIRAYLLTYSQAKG